MYVTCHIRFQSSVRLWAVSLTGKTCNNIGNNDHARSRHHAHRGSNPRQPTVVTPSLIPKGRNKTKITSETNPELIEKADKFTGGRIKVHDFKLIIVENDGFGNYIHSQSLCTLQSGYYDLNCYSYNYDDHDEDYYDDEIETDNEDSEYVSVKLPVSVWVNRGSIFNYRGKRNNYTGINNFCGNVFFKDDKNRYLRIPLPNISYSSEICMGTVSNHVQFENEDDLLCYIITSLPFAYFSSFAGDDYEYGDLKEIFDISDPDGKYITGNTVEALNYIASKDIDMGTAKRVEEADESYKMSFKRWLTSSQKNWKEVSDDVLPNM